MGKLLEQTNSYTINSRLEKIDLARHNVAYTFSKGRIFVSLIMFKQNVLLYCLPMLNLNKS